MNLGAKFKEFMGKLTIYDYIAIGIFITAFVVRLAFYEHCLWVDEARDLEITRNFMQTGKQLLFNEPYLQHPLMTYILLGISTTIFGLTLMGGTIVSVTLGALTVFVVYLIGKEVFNEKVGLAAALLMLIHPLHWFYSARILNDVPHTFFFAVAIFFFVKFIKTKENKFLYVTSIVVALAVLTRFTAFILLPIIGLYFIFDKKSRDLILKGILPKKNILIAIGLFSFIFFLNLLHNYISFGTPLDISIYTRHAFETLIDANPWWYYLATFHVWIRLSIAILFVLGLIAAFPKMSKLKMLLLLTILLTFIEISIVRVKTDRYILPILPFVVLFAGYFLVALWGTLKKYSKPIAHAIILIFLGVLLFSFYQEGSTMITQISKGFCGLDEAGYWISQNTNPSDNLFVGSYTIIGFYSNRNNLNPIPDTESEMNSLVSSRKVDYVVIDGIERTQPNYIFEYMSNNTHFEAIDAILDPQNATRPIVIMYKYVPNVSVY